MSQPREHSNPTSTYQDSIVDRALEISPVIDLNIEANAGDGDREIIRIGDLWFSYLRFMKWVEHSLEEVQKETSRDLERMPRNFDVQTLRDDDLVRVGWQLFSGSSIKRLLDDEETPGVLLSAGPVVPHSCPPPLTITKEVVVEKPSYWRSDKAVNAAAGSIAPSIVVCGVFLRSLSDFRVPYISMLFVGICVAVGLLGLGWLLMEQLAAKRKQSGQATPFAWRVFVLSCIMSAIYSVATLVVTIRFVVY